MPSKPTYKELEQRVKELEKESIKLEKVKKELKLTLETTTEGIWSWHFKNNEMYFSCQYYKMLGYRPNEFPANFEAWVDLVHPDDIEKALETTDVFFKTKPNIYENEFRLRTKNGLYRRVKSFAKVVERDSCGDAVYMIGYHRDITLKKQALDALVKEQENFSLVNDTVNDGYWDWNLKSLDIYFSPMWKKLLGYEDHEVKNKFSEWERLTIPEDVKSTLVMFNKLLANSQSKFKAEFKMLHKDGHLVNILSRATIIYDENGQGTRVVGTHTDVTKQKQLEKQLLQAQNMDTIGLIAGEIARDNNKLMNIIMENTKLAISKLENNNPINILLEKVLTAGEKSSELVQQFLSVGRNKNAALTLLNLNENVLSMLKILRQIVGENINLEWKPNADLWKISLTPSHVNQILTKLVVNARDAISKRGEIIIKTKNINTDELNIYSQFQTEGEHVMISVADNGSGLSEDVKKKMFKPFYTTKNLGKGTGLGLATVSGIVKDNNGFIEVNSEIGCGTEIQVFFPRCISN